MHQEAASNVWARVCSRKEVTLIIFSSCKDGYRVVAQQDNELVANQLPDACPDRPECCDAAFPPCSQSEEHMHDSSCRVAECNIPSSDSTGTTSPPRGSNLHFNAEKPPFSFHGLMNTSLSYTTKWCARLVDLILKTRTPFASYLSRTIQMSRTSPSGEPAPTFFPVPIPAFGVFRRMTRGCSSGAKHARYVSQAVHVAVMALNYWYSGGRYGEVRATSKGTLSTPPCLV